MVAIDGNHFQSTYQPEINEGKVQMTAEIKSISENRTRGRRHETC